MDTSNVERVPEISGSVTELRELRGLVADYAQWFAEVRKIHPKHLARSMTAPAAKQRVADAGAKLSAKLLKLGLLPFNRQTAEKIDAKLAVLTAPKIRRASRPSAFSGGPQRQPPRRASSCEYLTPYGEKRWRAIVTDLDGMVEPGAKIARASYNRRAFAIQRSDDGSKLILSYPSGLVQTIVSKTGTRDRWIISKTEVGYSRPVPFSHVENDPAKNPTGDAAIKTVTVLGTAENEQVARKAQSDLELRALQPIEEDLSQRVASLGNMSVSATHSDILSELADEARMAEDDSRLVMDEYAWADYVMDEVHVNCDQAVVTIGDRTYPLTNFRTQPVTGDLWWQFDRYGRLNPEAHRAIAQKLAYLQHIKPARYTHRAATEEALPLLVANADLLVAAEAEECAKSTAKRQA